MVRAGVVAHPRAWAAAGYHEIQQPPSRCRIIDREALCALLGTTDERLAAVQNAWIAAALAHGRPVRHRAWTEAVAVGRRAFVERVQEALGPRAWPRHVETIAGGAVRRDAPPAYAAHSSAQMAPPSKKSRLHSPQI